MQPENINKVNSAECVIIYDFYINLFKKKGFAELKKQTTDDIRENDILTINVPYLLSYHYIVAVINNDRSKVAIYQSIGESTRLFRIEIDYDTFIYFLKKCENFIISKYTIIDGLKELERISLNLYHMSTLNDAKNSANDTFISNGGVAANVSDSVLFEILLHPPNYDDAAFVETLESTLYSLLENNYKNLLSRYKFTMSIWSK